MNRERIIADRLIEAGFADLCERNDLILRSQIYAWLLEEVPKIIGILWLGKVPVFIVRDDPFYAEYVQSGDYVSKEEVLDYYARKLYNESDI
jgi:hypothetical protein